MQMRQQAGGCRLYNINVAYVCRIMQESKSGRRARFLEMSLVHRMAEIKLETMVYQRLDSLSEQLQTIVSIKIGNHVGGYKWSVLAFSYPNPLSIQSAVIRSEESLTPLQVRSSFRPEASRFEELWERGKLRVVQFIGRVNQLVPALTTRRKVVEINGYVGNVI